MVAKMKLRELYDISGAITYLLSNIRDAKASYWVNKMQGKVLSELKHINTVSEKLIKEKYGEKEKTPDGKETGRSRVPEDRVPEFNKELETLLDMETEIEIGTKKIPFKYIESIPLTPFQMMALEKFVDGPEEEKVPVADPVKKGKK